METSIPNTMNTCLQYESRVGNDEILVNDSSNEIDTISNYNTLKNKTCTQCKSLVGNNEILVSVWSNGMTSVLNCINCQKVNAATKI